jgi:hypothetical protein
VQPARGERHRAMQSKLPMHLSRRCGARTRGGSPCRSPAMSNGRCRMQGGRSRERRRVTGMPLGMGCYTAEAVAHRREIVALLRVMKALSREIGPHSPTSHGCGLARPVFDPDARRSRHDSGCSRKTPARRSAPLAGDKDSGGAGVSVSDLPFGAAWAGVSRGKQPSGR